MRFLITGGAGFIGSHLADELLAQGHRVRILDDLSTGSMDNIRHLKDSRFGYTIDTCANSSLVAELVDEADMVYHLAAAVGVDLIIESPVRTIETNVHCTEVVLAQASKKKKPVFLASTSEVYGKSTSFPFREDGDIVLGATSIGRWSYACSKAIDEFLALAYWKERKLPTVVARLFQHCRPATDRPLRHGRPDVRAAGTRRPAHHGIWRRSADALLLPCHRRRQGACRTHAYRRASSRRGV
jgi:UDP-glucose 4-epimerase